MRARPRITAQVTAVIALPFAVGMLAACSSPTAVTVPPSTLPPSSAATAPPSSAPAHAPSSEPTAPTTFAATGTVTDSQGDKATVSVSIGKPLPQLSLSQADLTDCGDDGELSYDANQNIALPVQITVTLTSSIATPLGLEIDGNHVVAPGGNANVNPNSLAWVTDGGGSLCSSGSSVGYIGLNWDSLAPDQPTTWSGWLLDRGVITPDDTSGSGVNQVFFLEPVVNFGANNADFFVADAAHSRNLLNCAAGVQGGPVIAVDPSVARANGCTAYTGS
jgi:hypothetical protein